MIFQCTGGGIFVPIFINAVPVPLAQDAYPIAIFLSFLLHEYVPSLREAMNKSAVFKSVVTVLFEAQRASVVVKLTSAAGAVIAPSDFSFSVFGPIFAGTIAGCGGAFLPLDKGLDPIKSGLAQPMLSAFVAATCFHLFMNTSLSDGVPQAKNQAQIAMALFFITYNLYSNVLGMVMPKKKLNKSLSTGADDDTTTMSDLSEDETTKVTTVSKKKKKAA